MILKQNDSYVLLELETHTLTRNTLAKTHAYIHTYRQYTNQICNSIQFVICLFIFVHLAHTAPSASFELPLMGFQFWDSFGAYFFSSVSFFFCTIMRSISCRHEHAATSTQRLSHPDHHCSPFEVMVKPRVFVEVIRLPMKGPSFPYYS